MFYKIKKMIPQGFKNIFHLCKAIFANFCFGFPSRNLIVIGVTGTNGKTTTTQMIGKVLESDGSKVAVSSTINFRIGEEDQINKTKFTTLSPWEFQKFISKAAKADCKYVVLEISSHALDQNRTWGIDFDVAVVTNVTREHLDYHKDMEQYRTAKEKLFRLLKEKQFWFYRELKQKNPKVAVVNLENDFAKNFLSHKADLKYGYSVKGGFFKKRKNITNVVAQHHQLSDYGSSFIVNDEKINLNLVGDFNIENALAAICVGLSQGIKIKKIKEGLAKIKKVPGRMEYVKNDLGISIIIDYALTPDSMEKVGKILRDKVNKRKGRFFWVFGSCGDRDRGKRPIMGKIALDYADFIILTNEDPYHENPGKIVEEVARGIENKTKNENFWIIMNREEAIQKALKEAQPGDTVLV
nr:UDP-N-acetylmuramoyl-L-alanyl-D-glutamate--2,6-diaminopimelate ligase [Patescibacteria group bacterium]